MGSQRSTATADASTTMMPAEAAVAALEAQDMLRLSVEKMAVHPMTEALQ